MSAEDVKLYSTWLKGTIAAIKKLSFYPPGHPVQLAALGPPLEFLHSILSAKQQLLLSLVDDKFIVNGETIPETYSESSLQACFKSGSIKSIEFKPNISADEFRVFLNYYVRRTLDRHYEQSLDQYLLELGVTSVVAKKVHYVAVSDREEIVSKTEKLRIDLKAQLSENLKDNPELLKDILFAGEGSSAVPQFGQGQGLSAEKVAEVFQTEVEQMSDRQIVDLIASRTKKEVEECGSEESQKKDDLRLLLGELQSQELRRALPRIEEILSRYSLVNKSYFKRLFSDRWKKNGQIIEEINSILNHLSAGIIKPEKLAGLPGMLLKLKEERVSTYVIEKLISELENHRGEVRQACRDLLEKIFIEAEAQGSELEANLVKRVCFERIKDVRLKDETFRELSKLGSCIAIALIKKRKHTEVREILLTIRSRCHKEVQFSENIQKASSEFLAEVGSQERARYLVQELLEQPDSPHSLQVEELLRLLATEKVAEELCSNLTEEDEQLQQRIIRILASMPDPCLNALNSVITTQLERRPGSGRKDSVGSGHSLVKAVLSVLGNINQLQAVNLIAKLRNSPDIQVRSDAAGALSRHPNQEARVFLLGMLKDPEQKVRNAVMQAILESADPRGPQALINHFAENLEDRKQACLALTKLHGENVTDFFLYLVTNKSRRGLEIPHRPDDECRLAALNYLSKNLTPLAASRLSDYLESQKKNLLSLFKKDPLLERIAELVFRPKSQTPLPSRG